MMTWRKEYFESFRLIVLFLLLSPSTTLAMPLRESVVTLRSEGLQSVGTITTQTISQFNVVHPLDGTQPAILLEIEPTRITAASEVDATVTNLDVAMDGNALIKGLTTFEVLDPIFGRTLKSIVLTPEGRATEIPAGSKRSLNNGFESKIIDNEEGEDRDVFGPPLSDFYQGDGVLEFKLGAFDGTIKIESDIPSEDLIVEDEIFIVGGSMDLTFRYFLPGDTPDYPFLPSTGEVVGTTTYSTFNGVLGGMWFEAGPGQDYYLFLSNDSITEGVRFTSLELPGSGIEGSFDVFYDAELSPLLSYFGTFLPGDKVPIPDGATTLAISGVNHAPTGQDNLPVLLGFGDFSAAADGVQALSLVDSSRIDFTVAALIVPSPCSGILSTIGLLVWSRRRPC